MKITEDDLSLRQYRALTVLVARGDLEAAATEAGVSVRCVKGWKTQPNFRKKLQEAVVKVFEASLAELTLGASDAAKELIRIIRDPECGDRIKVTAISTLFSTAALAKQLIIDSRIEAIEELLEDGHKGAD